MLLNGNNQELVGENTTTSIERNTRAASSNDPVDIAGRPRVLVDTVYGGTYTYRTYIGDASASYLNLSNYWYHPYVGTPTVEQRQELSTATNTNAALCRKRWAYS